MPYEFKLPELSHSASPVSGGGSQTEELIALTLSVLRGMWRFRWPALAVAWVVSLPGWALVYRMPDIYQASARIYVDTESMLKRLVGDLTINADVMTEINVLTRALLSRPHLERVAEETGLDARVNTTEEFEQLVDGLQQQIQITGGQESIFTIRYRDVDRKKAEEVTATLLKTFVDDALGRQRSDSGDARRFLDDQIKEYERRLADAEQRLADFKRLNVGLMPGEAGDYYTRLQGAMVTLERLEADLRLAIQRRDEFEKQLVGEEPVFGLFGGSVGSGVSTDPAVARYQAELDNLLLRYTEKHPDVIAIRQTLERLTAERRLRDVPTDSAQPRTGNTLDINPVYQRMRTGLSETEVEIATLRVRIAEQRAHIDELQALVDTVPDIERQLVALNRDYRVTRDQFETLLRKRESLHMTGEVEESGDDVQFRIIDPPLALLTPVGPNRTLFLAAVFVAAVSAGLGLAFVMQQIRPIFLSRRELRAATGMPVVGTVSLALTTSQRRRERRDAALFAAGFMVLVLTLVCAVLIENQTLGPLMELFSGDIT